MKHLDPIFKTLAPGRGEIDRTPGREKAGGTAEEGYLHCGPSGAGHFVKMVHNGIEYGLMAAYAEGLNILKHANVGKSHRETDAETAPMRNADHYQYDFNLADITEVWRRGSVVASWLLDLTAISLLDQPTLEKFSGRVSDSGEGRWTIMAGHRIDRAGSGTERGSLSAVRFARRRRIRRKNFVRDAFPVRRARREKGRKVDALPSSPRIAHQKAGPRS